MLVSRLKPDWEFYHGDTETQRGGWRNSRVAEDGHPIIPPTGVREECTERSEGLPPYTPPHTPLQEFVPDAKQPVRIPATSSPCLCASVVKKSQASRPSHPIFAADRCWATRSWSSQEIICRSSSWDMSNSRLSVSIWFSALLRLEISIMAQ